LIYGGELESIGGVANCDDSSRVRWKSVNTYRTTRGEEKSSFTFEDAMAFVGAEYAVAA
jgi:hypothetical protein